VLCAERIDKFGMFVIVIKSSFYLLCFEIEFTGYVRKAPVVATDEFPNLEDTDSGSLDSGFPVKYVRCFDDPNCCTYQFTLVRNAV